MTEPLRHQLLVVAIAAAVFFVNLGGPRLFDEDEPKNAACGQEMFAAAENLEFERAARLRDKLRQLREEHGELVDVSSSNDGGRRGKRGAAKKRADAKKRNGARPTARAQKSRRASRAVTRKRKS